MAVKFSQNVHFTLDSTELYGAFVSDVKFVVRESEKGTFKMYDMKFEVFDPRDVYCIEGKRDKEGNIVDKCVGKTVKCTLWLSKEDGGLPQASENMVRILAESKGLDMEDDAFNLEDLKGAVCLMGVVNVPDRTDKTKLYSNVDIATVKKARPELKQLCKLYKEAKGQKKNSSDSAITGESKPASKVAPKPEAELQPAKTVDETTDGKNPFLS